MHLQTGSAVDLMQCLEQYSVTLARNMPQIYTQPFDVVHENLGESIILLLQSASLFISLLLWYYTVIGLDTIHRGNFSSVAIPKYNNKVQNKEMFDPDTQALLPGSAFTFSSSGTWWTTDSAPVSLSDFMYTAISFLPAPSDDSPVVSSAIVSYVMYRHLGALLPKNYDHGIRWVKIWCVSSWVNWEFFSREFSQWSGVWFTC